MCLVYYHQNININVTSAIIILRKTGTRLIQPPALTVPPPKGL